MSSTFDVKNTYTCITCQVVFKNPDLQRIHYRTDWHRYNLKRKVAEMPPVTVEGFQQKLDNQKNTNNLNKQNTSVYCKVCRKHFGNQNAYENHLNSKKHKYNETIFVELQGGKEINKKDLSNNVCIDSDEEIEELDSDEWEDDTENPIDDNNCLFCLHHSRNMIKNLEHMTIVHSFFIPDIEYCVDMVGLLKYLGEKIAIGFICLWCNEKGRTFHSVDAVRRHMLDKGHCKMLHEGLALTEYADFYDYSSSYPDAAEHLDADQEVSVPEIGGTEYQLVLPSGVIVGHRSLLRYYKQNMNANIMTLEIHSKNTKKLHKVLATYRALGWTAMEQEAAARKAKDIHFLKRMQAKYNMKLGLKGNKLQTHYRPQVKF